MREHTLNSQNPFIRGYYIDTKLCDDIYTESENNLERFKSGIKTYKNSELAEFSSDIKSRYISELATALNKYKTEFAPTLDMHLAKWMLFPDVKVQRYDAGKYYKGWHCEQNGFKHIINRHLVYMTYLNDIEEGGGTEFLYQNLQVKPEKGLTLIWPADWTHMHQGMPCDNEVKYIITGWFVYDTSEW